MFFPPNNRCHTQAVHIADENTLGSWKNLKMLYLYFHPLQFLIEISACDWIWFRNRLHVLFCLGVKTPYFGRTGLDTHILKIYFFIYNIEFTVTTADSFAIVTLISLDHQRTCCSGLLNNIRRRSEFILVFSQQWLVLLEPDGQKPGGSCPAVNYWSWK